MSTAPAVPNQPIELPALVRRRMAQNDAATVGGADGLERLAVQGDLSKLTPQERVQYYGAVCRSLGLNPLTQPFAYLALGGRTVLYATKACTDQLRAIHNVTIEIVSRERIDDVYVVTARATRSTAGGGSRSDEEIGAVSLAGLKGEALANGLMKASTKSKRRVTLAICGLGWMDELEVDTVPGARMVRVDQETGEVLADGDDVPTTYGGLRTGADEDDEAPDEDPVPVPTAAHIRRLTALSAALRVRMPAPRTATEAVDLIEAYTQRLAERGSGGEGQANGGPAATGGGQAR